MRISAKQLPPLLNPTRVAPAITDRENNYFITTNDIIDGVIFESVQSYAAGLEKFKSGHFRIVNDEFNGRVNVIKKTQAQAGLLLFIPAGGFCGVEFSVRDFSDDAFHGAVPESVRWSPPTAEAVPGAP